MTFTFYEKTHNFVVNLIFNCKEQQPYSEIHSKDWMVTLSQIQSNNKIYEVMSWYGVYHDQDISSFLRWWLRFIFNTVLGGSRLPYSPPRKTLFFSLPIKHILAGALPLTHTHTQNNIFLYSTRICDAELRRWLARHRQTEIAFTSRSEPDRTDRRPPPATCQRTDAAGPRPE